MCKKSLCVFFIVSFLQTGISNSRISISVNEEGDDIIFICVFTGNESLTQVNWEMVQGSNHTKIGIFHPSQGIHIFSEHFGKVKIHGQQTPPVSSDLSLQKTALSEIGLVCCQFVTFPSGIMKQCIDTRNTVIKSLIKSSAEPYGVGRKQGLFGQFGALISGCILSLLFLIIPIYICQWCFCKRKQVVQHVRTGPSTFTEMYTEDAEVLHTPSPLGFDPTKLYAKIKKDLHYGRLWKAYQGRAQASKDRCLTGSRQIYYSLGENPLVQRDQEHRPNIPEEMTKL